MTTSVTGAIDKISALPDQFVRKAKEGVAEVSYTAGYNAGKGLGWSLLPPVLIGTGVILVALLGYRYVSIQIEKQAELAPAY
jgi:hypothetical protein